MVFARGPIYRGLARLGRAEKSPKMNFAMEPPKALNKLSAAARHTRPPYEESFRGLHDCPVTHDANRLPVPRASVPRSAARGEGWCPITIPDPFSSQAAL